MLWVGKDWVGVGWDWGGAGHVHVSLLWMLRYGRLPLEMW